MRSFSAAKNEDVAGVSMIGWAHTNVWASSGMWSSARCAQGHVTRDRGLKMETRSSTCGRVGGRGCALEGAGADGQRGGGRHGGLRRWVGSEEGRAVLKGGEGGGGEGFVTPTETNVHGDALCFIVKTWARHKTTETGVNNGRRLAALGGWRLAVGGGWQLAVGGPKDSRGRMRMWRMTCGSRLAFMATSSGLVIQYSQDPEAVRSHVRSTQTLGHSPKVQAPGDGPNANASAKNQIGFSGAGGSGAASGGAGGSFDGEARASGM